MDTLHIFKFITLENWLFIKQGKIEPLNSYKQKTYNKDHLNTFNMKTLIKKSPLISDSMFKMRIFLNLTKNLKIYRTKTFYFQNIGYYFKILYYKLGNMSQFWILILNMIWNQQEYIALQDTKLFYCICFDKVEYFPFFRIKKLLLEGSLKMNSSAPNFI